MNFNDLVNDGLTPKVEPKPWMKEKKFTLIQDIDHLNAVIDKAIEGGLCALDLETTGLDNRIDATGRTLDEIVGYCLSYDGYEGFYVPVGHKVLEGSKRKPHPLNLNYFEVGKAIKRLCEGCVTIYHNAAFDHEFLYGLGPNIGIDIDRASDFEDTLILDYLRDSTDKRHGLKHLSERFLGLEMIDLKDLFRTGTRDLDFSTLDPSAEEVLWYAGSDGLCTYLLFDFYCRHAPDVKDYPENLEGPTYEYRDPRTIYGEQKSVYIIEKAMIPALRWTERNRPLVDIAYVKNIKEECETLIKETIKEIEEELFKNIHDPNIRDIRTFRNLYDVTSPQQLGQALEKLKQTNPAFKSVEFEVTEKSGQIKTDAASMDLLAERYGDSFPFLAKIQVFRSLQKALGTYITPLYENTDWEDSPRGPRKRLNDSSIRFSFLPHRVDTGRFAASKGSPPHGFSGINVQSTPATYNFARFEVKEVYKRPRGQGQAGKPFVDGYAHAVLNSGFLKRVYDRHFIRDNKTESEYCIRKGCEGCPFESKCDRSEPFEKSFLSIEASVRPAIVARPNHVLVSIDFSGVELRVAANICEEPQWIHEFYRCGTCGHEFEPPTKLDRRKGSTSPGVHNWRINERPPSHCPTCGSDKIGDLHTLTAKIVYGDDVVDLPSSEFKAKRESSKGVNFGIIYGGGGSAVAGATGTTFEQGREIRDRILRSLNTFGRWMDTVIRDARRDLYVTTAIGRRIRLHEINSSVRWIKAKQERNAINSIVQGSATGDLIKYAMGSIYRECKKRGWLDKCKMILTIHDELVFEISQDILEEALPIINECMTEFGDRMNWPIVLATDIEFGTYWGASHNWREIKDVNVSTGMTDASVPIYLVDKVKFNHGMWYEDPQTKKKMVWSERGSSPGFIEMTDFKSELTKADSVSLSMSMSMPMSMPSSLEAEETARGLGEEERQIPKPVRSPEDLSPQKDLPKTEETYDLGKMVEPKKANSLPVINLPHYVHTIKYPLVTDSDASSYLLRLRKLENAFRSLRSMGEIRPTHVLVVETLEGDQVIGPESNFLIEPSIFKILSFYEGV